MKATKLVTSAFLAVAGMSATSAMADTLVNIDLSGASVGGAIPTAPAGGNPVTAYTAIGGYNSDPLTPVFGWTYPHAGLGTAQVSNVAGIGKAADLTTDPTNQEVGALLMDTSLNFQDPRVKLSFDVNVLRQAAGGYGQAVDGGATPLLFGVRLFSPTGGNWATTFNLSPTSTTGGIFGFRDATNSTLQSLGTYTVGSADHIEIDVDYTAGTADAYVNNTLVYSGYPLRGGAQGNPTTSEMFMYLNGSLGTANEVAIGNVNIQTIPAPAAVWGGGALLGVLGCGRLLRRRRS